MIHIYRKISSALDVYFPDKFLRMSCLILIRSRNKRVAVPVRLSAVVDTLSTWKIINLDKSFCRLVRQSVFHPCPIGLVKLPNPSIGISVGTRLWDFIFNDKISWLSNANEDLMHHNYSKLLTQVGYFSLDRGLKGNICSGLCQLAYTDAEHDASFKLEKQIMVINIIVIFIVRSWFTCHRILQVFGCDYASLQEGESVSSSWFSF